MKDAAYEFRVFATQRPHGGVSSRRCAMLSVNGVTALGTFNSFDLVLRENTLVSKGIRDEFDFLRFHRACEIPYLSTLQDTLEGLKEGVNRLGLPWRIIEALLSRIDEVVNPPGVVLRDGDDLESMVSSGWGEFI